MTPEAGSLQGTVITATIQRHLRAIISVWPITAWIKQPKESSTRQAYGPRSPANDNAISARREAGENLASWAGVVCEIRKLHPRIDTSDVSALANFLTIHAALLAEIDPASAEHEIGLHARRLVAIAGQVRTRRLRLGPCPVVGCTAWLLGILIEGRPAAVRCAAQEPHQWPREQWEHLGLTLAVPVPAQRRSWELLANLTRVEYDSHRAQDS